MSIDSERFLRESEDGPLRIYNENGKHHEGGNRYFLISNTHPDVGGGPWHYSGIILRPLNMPLNEPLMGKALLIDSELREEVPESKLMTRSSYHSLLKKYPKLVDEDFNL